MGLSWMKEYLLGIDEAESLLYPARLEAFLNLRGNIDETPAGRQIKPEFFTAGFHEILLKRRGPPGLLLRAVYV